MSLASGRTFHLRLTWLFSVAVTRAQSSRSRYDWSWPSGVSRIEADFSIKDYWKTHLARWSEEQTAEQKYGSRPLAESNEARVLAGIAARQELVAKIKCLASELKSTTEFRLLSEHAATINRTFLQELKQQPQVARPFQIRSPVSAELAKERLTLAALIGK